MGVKWAAFSRGAAVFEPTEWDICHPGGAAFIPIGDVTERLSEIDRFVDEHLRPDQAFLPHLPDLLAEDLANAVVGFLGGLVLLIP